MMSPIQKILVLLFFATSLYLQTYTINTYFNNHDKLIRYYQSPFTYVKNGVSRRVSQPIITQLKVDS